MSNKKMSEHDKKKRQEYLANETPTQRTKRVIQPRIKTTIENIRRLGNSFESPRYIFTPEQKEKIEKQLLLETNMALQKLKGNTHQKEVEEVL